MNLISFIYYNTEAHIIRPWELIYPRGKEGLPSLNPIGGKYVVKLFWLVCMFPELTTLQYVVCLILFFYFFTMQIIIIIIIIPLFDP